jgi:hypothetical protein
MKGASVIVHRLGAWSALAIAVASIAIVGCTGQPGRSVAVAVTPVPAVSGAPSGAPETPLATPVPPTIGPSRAAAASATDAPMAQPPAARLAVEGGDPVIGELGSYAWDNSGSDSPWVPGTPMRVGHGEQLSLTLGAAVRIEHWTAARTPAATVGSGVVGMGEGTDAPTFASPPRGTWSVNVTTWFADNGGSAAYYWMITVD